MTAAELRRLLDAATPRPWTVILPGDLSWGERKQWRCVAFSRRRGEMYTTSPLCPKDADLIVAAVNALPDLLDRIAALEAALDKHFPFIRFAGGLPYLVCHCGWDDRGDTGWGDHLAAIEDPSHD